MTTDATPQVQTPGAGSWLRWVVAAVFGLLFAFAIVIAVFNLIAYNVAVGAGAARTLTGLGWVVLLLPVVFPAAVYLGSFVFARRRRVWQLALVFTAGLGLVAVFWLNVLVMQMNGTALVV